MNLKKITVYYKYTIKEASYGIRYYLSDKQIEYLGKRNNSRRNGLWAASAIRKSLQFLPVKPPRYFSILCQTSSLPQNSIQNRERNLERVCLPGCNNVGYKKNRKIVVASPCWSRWMVLPLVHDKINGKKGRKTVTGYVILDGSKH